MPGDTLVSVNLEHVETLDIKLQLSTMPLDGQCHKCNAGLYFSTPHLHAWHHCALPVMCLPCVDTRAMSGLIEPLKA